MAAPVFLYPSLTDNMKDSLKIQSKGWNIYYHDSDGEPVELTFRPAEINDKLNCLETDGRWNPDQYDLCVDKKMVFSRYRGLFGPSGIACRNAVLGISVVWTSVESRQRGAFCAGTFGVNNKDYKNEKDTTSVEISISKEFKAARLRGDVTFSVCLYIAESGAPGKNEKHLANESGMILGEIDSFTLRLDGKGSLFPIYESEEKDKPLWYVTYNCMDPMYDQFHENVSIIINKAHKNYKFIDRDNNNFCSPMLSEIMAAAISGIIEEARNSVYWDQITSDDDAGNGSVAEVIRYFRDTLGWDISSPVSVSESARRFFDRRMHD